jgi:hypothetical protein
MGDALLRQYGVKAAGHAVHRGGSGVLLFDYALPLVPQVAACLTGSKWSARCDRSNAKCSRPVLLRRTGATAEGVIWRLARAEWSM